MSSIAAPHVQVDPIDLRMRRIEGELRLMARLRHCCPGRLRALRKRVARLETQLEQAPPGHAASIADQLVEMELDLFEVEALMPYAA